MGNIFVINNVAGIKNRPTRGGRPEESNTIVITEPQHLQW